jgi:hypothetical protein
MFLIEAVAAVFVFRWAMHWLAGAALGILFVIVCALQGVWWPLALLIVGIAVVVGIVRRVARVDTPARQVGDLGAEYSFAPSGLRADFGARLDRSRRWASR